MEDYCLKSTNWKAFALYVIFAGDHRSFKKFKQYEETKKALDKLYILFNNIKK